MNSGTESPRTRHGGRITAILASAMLASAAWGTPGPARGATVSSSVEARLAVDGTSEVPVLVTLNDQVDGTDFSGRPTALIRAMRATAHRTQGAVLDDLDGPVRRFWLVNALATTVTRDELEALRSDPAVDAIELDAPIRITGTAAPGAATDWGIGAIHADAAWSGYGVTGAGVRVGSIDTGVDAANPELAGAVVAWHDFVNGQATPYDDNGHGTHTVGTMVARNLGGTVGVAPGAQAIVAKAIGADGTASGANLLAAAQWMTDPDGNPATADFPAVINNSWTSVGATNEWFRPMVQKWVELGITPVFGAGNTGGEVGNPASYPEVIAVGATDESGAIWGNSSRGVANWTIDGVSTPVSKPDVAAPGVYITSTVGSGFGSYTGTSMAAPHVAGTIALLKQARPDLTPEGIRQILRGTAADRGAPGPDLEYGAGVIDAAAAVAATGAPAAAATYPPATAPAAAVKKAPKVRVLRIVRRGSALFVQGRVTGPARVKVQVRRAAPATNAFTTAGSAVRVNGGRFSVKISTKGLRKGSYTLVVVASTASGERSNAATRRVTVR